MIGHLHHLRPLRFVETHETKEQKGACQSSRTDDEDGLRERADCGSVGKSKESRRYNLCAKRMDDAQSPEKATRLGPTRIGIKY